MTNKKGYIAGKLFKQGDIKQRLYEDDLVKKRLTEIDFYNPIANDEINKKSNLPTAKEIYDGDTKKVLESHYLLAELDDEDPGTIAEISQCHMVNLLKDKIRSIRGQYGNLTIDELMEFLDKEVPDKKIFTHLSDIRVSTSGEYDGKYVPFGINQYVVGLIEEYGNIYPSAEEAINQIKVDLMNK